MDKKSIAIIGGGCSGVMLASLLSPTYNVTLFEKEAQLGGHVFTYNAHIDNKNVPIDVGVDHINEKLCPNIFMILDKLQIDTFVAPLSMSVLINQKGHLASWSNASNLGELREKFVVEFDKFHRDMTHIATHFDPKYLKTTVIDFLKSNNYSADFAHLALVPLLTSYYGCKAHSLEYSILYVAVSFDMSLLSFFTPGYWRKISGGMGSYIQKISEQICGDIFLSSSVTKVTKNSKEKLEVLLDNGKKFEFDEVVFATSAKDASDCLNFSDPDYKGLLESFGYVPIEAILHTHEYKYEVNGEYFAFYQKEGDAHGTLTRINRNLYPYEKLKTPLNVAFNPTETIEEDKVLCKKQWKLQTLRPVDGLFRSKIRDIQGKNGIWFCGTDTSVTGHEGAVVSAFVMADKLGVPYEFKENKAALAQFNTVKFIMGI